MEWKEVAIGLLSAVSLVGGWFLRQLWDAVKDLQKDLANLREHIAQSYVQHDRLQEMLNPIMELLREVRSKLDSKADK